MGKEMHKKLRQRGDKTQSEEATKLSSAEATVEMRRRECRSSPTPKDKGSRQGMASAEASAEGFDSAPSPWRKGEEEAKAKKSAEG